MPDDKKRKRDDGQVIADIPHALRRKAEHKAEETAEKDMGKGRGDGLQTFCGNFRDGLQIEHVVVRHVAHHGHAQTPQDKNRRHEKRQDPQSSVRAEKAGENTAAPASGFCQKEQAAQKERRGKKCRGQEKKCFVPEESEKMYGAEDPALRRRSEKPEERDARRNDVDQPARKRAFAVAGHRARRINRKTI